ncbi:MAG: hypothetical protein N2V72_00020 [Methanophagales archaeon]|nr:hypothetical protein [Methanophagales archaeon]
MHPKAIGMEKEAVAGTGEPATQEGNAGMEMVKSVLEKNGYDSTGMSEEQAIALFNELLEEEEKEYWLCQDCGKFHPRSWTHCDLPCVQYERSRQTTEEEYERIYDFFDPADYRQDPYYLQMPHTKLYKWLIKAEKVYRVKTGLKTFDIHNSADAPKREHVMTEEERLRRLEEIQAFYREKQYRHKAWRNTTPTIREYRPDNCRLEPVIRVITARNGENEKIVERIEYVRA